MHRSTSDSSQTYSRTHSSSSLGYSSSSGNGSRSGSGSSYASGSSSNTSPSMYTTSSKTSTNLSAALDMAAGNRWKNQMATDSAFEGVRQSSRSRSLQGASRSSSYSSESPHEGRRSQSHAPSGTYLAYDQEPSASRGPSRRSQAPEGGALGTSQAGDRRGRTSSSQAPSVHPQLQREESRAPVSILISHSSKFMS